MLITLRIDKSIGEHILFTLFVDGVYAGRLKMRLTDYSVFVYRLRIGSITPDLVQIKNAPYLPGATHAP